MTTPTAVYACCGRVIDLPPILADPELATVTPETTAIALLWADAIHDGECGGDVETDVEEREVR